MCHIAGCEYTVKVMSLDCRLHNSIYLVHIHPNTKSTPYDIHLTNLRLDPLRSSSHIFLAALLPVFNISDLVHRNPDYINDIIPLYLTFGCGKSLLSSTKGDVWIKMLGHCYVLSYTDYLDITSYKIVPY